MTACPFEHLILTLSAARVDAYQHAGEARSSALENSELARAKERKGCRKACPYWRGNEDSFFFFFFLPSPSTGLQTGTSGIDCSSLTGPLSHLHQGGQLLTWCFGGESAGEQDWRGWSSLFQRYHSFLQEAIRGGEGLCSPLPHTQPIYNIHYKTKQNKKNVLHSWWELQKGRKRF